MDKLVNFKKFGFIQQRQANYFSLTIPFIGGQLTSNHLKIIYLAAEKYAQSKIHLTSRQGIKIPFIHVDNIESIKKFLLDGGIDINSFNLPYSITACQGNQICRRGLIDTFRLANTFDERYRELKLPHKIKVGIAGCPNNCAQVKSNDIGIKGCGKNQFIVNFGEHELSKINGEDELFESIDTILAAFVHTAKPKERFKDMVERLIFENFAEKNNF